MEAVADRVVFISRGRLVFDGTPAALKEKGSLEESFYRLTRDEQVNPSPVEEEKSK